MAKLKPADIGGIFIFAAIALIVILALAWVNLKDEQDIDKTTFCPKDKKYPQTAIMIDATDSLNKSQTKELLGFLDTLRHNMEKHEWVAVYLLNEDNLVLPSPLFALCNPGAAKDANKWIENPLLVEKRFNEKFGVVLENAINAIGLEKTEEQNTSPIMEMIKAVALVRDFNAQSPKRKLIIVSDMLQNVSGYSHYREGASFEQFAASDYSKKTVDFSLLEVDVEILYLKRADTRHLQTLQHVRFWEQFFQSLDASVTKVVPLL